MKIQFKSASGSVIVVMLITVILIGITLGSYLSMVSNQNRSIMRSMQWNYAVAVAEAGIEEAMAHLNANTTNRVKDGWAMNGTNAFKEKVIGDSKYRTFVNINVEPPAVISEGWVASPTDAGYLPQPRVIRVLTTNDALFSKGMVAKGLIDLAGNNIKTDSFDSTDTNYSGVNGKYLAAKNKDGGDIATNSKLINVGNADIYGKASTGPGGIVSLGPNGTVGSKAWHANPANHGTSQPGWTSDDMNVQFPDVKNPMIGKIPMQYQVGVKTWSYTTNGVTYDQTLPVSGDYVENGNLSITKKLLIMGNVNLLVKGGVSISGNGSITLAPGATLNLYVAGASADLTGNGVINQSGKAGAFAYWGLPSNTAVKMGGNGELAGTIYAPSADLTLAGGGSGTDDFIGASVTKSVKMGGHYNFHYDESLGKFGPKRGYTIVTWNEVAPMGM